MLWTRIDIDVLLFIQSVNKVKLSFSWPISIYICLALFLYINRVQREHRHEIVDDIGTCGKAFSLLFNMTHTTKIRQKSFLFEKG